MEQVKQTHLIYQPITQETSKIIYRDHANIITSAEKQVKKNLKHQLKLFKYIVWCLTVMFKVNQKIS
jgi:hypothetical protein